MLIQIFGDCKKIRHGHRIYVKALMKKDVGGKYVVYVILLILILFSQPTFAVKCNSLTNDVFKSDAGIEGVEKVLKTSDKASIGIKATINVFQKYGDEGLELLEQGMKPSRIDEISDVLEELKRVGVKGGTEGNVNEVAAFLKLSDEYGDGYTIHRNVDLFDASGRKLGEVDNLVTKNSNIVDITEVKSSATNVGKADKGWRQVDDAKRFFQDGDVASIKSHGNTLTNADLPNLNANNAKTRVFGPSDASASLGYSDATKLSSDDINKILGAFIK